MSKISTIFNVLLGNTKQQPKKQERKSSIIARPTYNRVDMEQGRLLQAIEAALDAENTDRQELYDIYANAAKDPQVISEMDKAISCVVTESYVIERGEKEDKESEKLLRRPWFDKFLEAALSEEFYEYTLVEFGQQDENGEFMDCMVFPRKHINPFKRIILPQVTDSEGVAYGDSLTEFYLIEIGDAFNLGKMETISKEVIWKSFARSDWSEFNERWGKPFLDFAVASDDEAEITQKTQMAENFGSNGYVIRDIDDQINIVSTNGSGACDTFERKAKFCDEQISKLINGQVGTSDTKSFVGAAEVHERILDEFTKARLIRISNIINYKLFPFLIAHGYKLNGCEFKYTRLQPQQQQQKEKETEDSVKKKVPIAALPDWVLTIAD